MFPLLVAEKNVCLSSKIERKGSATDSKLIIGVVVEVVFEGVSLAAGEGDTVGAAISVGDGEEVGVCSLL